MFLKTKMFQLQLAKVHLQEYSSVAVDPGTTMILFCFNMGFAAIVLKAHTGYSLGERSIDWLPLHVRQARMKLLCMDIPKTPDPWEASSIVILVTNAYHGHGEIRGHKHVHVAPTLG